MIKVGIFFGGKSREREISFAGGRTVYDALDKSLFEAIPIFIDGLGNFIELDWPYIYKGTIRDFFPPYEFLPSDSQRFQIYSESLGDAAMNPELLKSIGKPLSVEALKSTIDFAFLALHGAYGEDGYLQGLLDYIEIPYSGSGVFPSAIGISKARQKKLMEQADFLVNPFISFSKAEWEKNPKECFFKAEEKLKGDWVIKASSQGSSIGVHFLEDKSFLSFFNTIEESLFNKTVNKEDWVTKTQEEKEVFLTDLFDLQHGIGLPVEINKEIIYRHTEAQVLFDDIFKTKDMVFIHALNGEHEIVVEEKIIGREFSCIVVKDEEGKCIALPPTEIKKAQELFDYRSKYLPGITRKITPMKLANNYLNDIRRNCVELFKFFEFNVYARIDGFITKEGDIYLNDPNTTSGMMPSSFFFHQAAEIGLNPTQFLTYIIHQSLLERKWERYRPYLLNEPFNELAGEINETNYTVNNKTTVGVIFGGYSSERHISLESGRNVFEKLNSSGKYNTVPIFLSKNEKGEMELYELPINLMLKDNADDIKEKIATFKIMPISQKIIQQSQAITDLFSTTDYNFYPTKIELDDLPNRIDFAFIALHGRPGEDGTIQKELDRLDLPYNGSGSDSSALTIDKFKTNALLRENDVLVADHCMVWKEDWVKDSSSCLDHIEKEFGFPLIAKPADDGCSSAVKKIDSKDELRLFATAILRDNEELSKSLEKQLELKPNEEFPIKKGFLIEELIKANDAKHFLEITGGMLIKTNKKGEKSYQVFEASEAVAEGGILSLEEKFLAGEGQNITPARYNKDAGHNQTISNLVKAELAKTADILGVEGYCRIDAFVRIYSPTKVDVIIIEINSLPGLTPATAIFHQAAIDKLKPAQFLDKLISIGKQRKLSSREQA